MSMSTTIPNKTFMISEVQVIFSVQENNGSKFVPMVTVIHTTDRASRDEAEKHSSVSIIN